MILYREGAIRDITEAARWYRRRRPAYEAKFFERLRETVRRIEEAPRSCVFAIEAEGVRKARVLRSPYSVAYVIVSGRGSIGSKPTIQQFFQSAPDTSRTCDQRFRKSFSGHALGVKPRRIRCKERTGARSRRLTIRAATRLQRSEIGVP